MKKLTFAACAALLAIHQIVEHEALKLVEQEVRIRNLPCELVGFRIAHISDLHGKRFGKGNSRLARLIDSKRPDILCMTGDMVNGKRDDGSAFIELLANLKGKYPRLYVTGNHEVRNTWLNEKSNLYGFLSALKSNGTTILNGSSYSFEGLQVSFHGMKDSRKKHPDIEESLGAKDEEDISIALIHRPTRFEAAAKAGYDLILSGHLHGGVVRIPFAGGLLSPDKVLFPKYDKGIFHDFGSTLFITSGLGNGRFYPKLMNRPEVVLITLVRG